MKCITCEIEKDEFSKYKGVCTDCYEFYRNKFGHKLIGKKILGKGRLHGLIRKEIGKIKIENREIKINNILDKKS